MAAKCMVGGQSAATLVHAWQRWLLHCEIKWSTWWRRNLACACCVSLSDTQKVLHWSFPRMLMILEGNRSHSLKTNFPKKEIYIYLYKGLGGRKRSNIFFTPFYVLQNPLHPLPSSLRITSTPLSLSLSALTSTLISPGKSALNKLSRWLRRSLLRFECRRLWGSV